MLWKKFPSTCLNKSPFLSEDKKFEEISVLSLSPFFQFKFHFVFLWDVGLLLVYEQDKFILYIKEVENLCSQFERSPIHSYIKFLYHHPADIRDVFLEERGDEANSFCYNNMDVTWKQNFHKIIINHEAITLLFT